MDAARKGRMKMVYRKKKEKAQKKAQAAAESFVSHASQQTDPNGSYTGEPRTEDKMPVQDVDDL
jgi:hypothetical protein